MRWLEGCLKDSPHVSARADATKRSHGRNFRFFLERSPIQERSARGGREERIEEYEESLSFLSITPSPHDLRAVNPSRFFSAADGRALTAIGGMVPSWPGAARSGRGNSSQSRQSLLRLSGRPAGA